VLVAEQVTLLVVPAESAVLVEARSTVGPITFGTMTMSGRIDAALVDGAIDTRHPTAATFAVPVLSLTSGNQLYDAEMHSRLDARRFPDVTAELHTITPLSRNRYQVAGALTIHGTTRELSAGLELSLSDTGTALVTGYQTIDMRDFAIGLPSMLMLKIFPDVTVRFQLQAVRA
jgi:polyisoprenoid-binding protein YceI